jgi:ATP-dependent Lon protease
MNEAVYGHLPAKLEILQYHTASLLSNGKKTGSRVLGLVGPPGVGKTSLVVNGVSAALNLPFYHMSIGGMRDVTYFTGSLPCWKGSHQSVFADILISHGHQAIVYIDEIDKVASETAQDIYGWLTHAVDPLANNRIRDSFLGVDLDLSGLTFIFSYNESDMLPAPLRDRINEVRLNSFSPEEKKIIAKQFIIPECLMGYGLTTLDIVFADNIISEINISDSGEGVRQLKKLYQTIIDRIMLRIACTKEGLNNYKARVNLPIQACKGDNKNNNFFDFLLPIKSSLPYTVKPTDIIST